MASHADTLSPSTANPAPLGLSGFALSTILFNLHNAELIELNSMLMAMGVFYGGIAQVLVGCMEWHRGNTFGTTAFTSFGFFWIAIVGLRYFPLLGVVPAPSVNAMIFFQILWGLFASFLFIATLRMSKGLMFIFGFTVLHFFLTICGLATQFSLVKIIAGYEGVLCGLVALYVAMAQVINEVYKKEYMPL